MNIPLNKFTFTPQARSVLELADDESRRLNHRFVGTEHILLALLREDSVSPVFTAFALDAAKVRAEIEKLVAIGPAGELQPKRPLTPRASRAIEFAAEEARRLLQQATGPEHLLLGLILEGSGVAAQVLQNLGLDPETIRPVALKIRLMQIKLVERIVRPIRAVTPRKRKMREELLAHLEAIYEQEQARLNDPQAAIAEAARRLGDPAELSRELQEALHPLQRQSYRIERWFWWCRSDSAARNLFRLAIIWLIEVVVTGSPLVIASVHRLGWDSSVWIALRPFIAIWAFMPVAAILIGNFYPRMRDAMWGAFGRRRSKSRVMNLALLLAGGFALACLGCISVLYWDLDRTADQLSICLADGLVTALICLTMARVRGGIEIADQLWSRLEIDAPAPTPAES